MQHPLHPTKPARCTIAALSRAAARASTRHINRSQPSLAEKYRRCATRHLPLCYRAAMAPAGPPPHIPCAGGPVARRSGLPSFRIVSGPGELLLPALFLWSLEAWSGPGAPSCRSEDAFLDGIFSKRTGLAGMCRMLLCRTVGCREQPTERPGTVRGQAMEGVRFRRRRRSAPGMPLRVCPEKKHPLHPGRRRSGSGVDQVQTCPIAPPHRRI